MIKLKTLLKELGEGVAPYQWSGPQESRNGDVTYFFTTEDNDDYQVIFSQSNESLEKLDWSVDFFAKDNNRWSAEIDTNRGRQYKIISTVMDIISSFIKKYPAYTIHIIGSDYDGQRNKLYTLYAEKNISKLQGWKYKIEGGGGILLYKRKPSAKSLLKTGEPIINGNLDLEGSNITKLPDNITTVNGNLILRNSLIMFLPDNLTVNGYLDLSDTPITKLPNNLTVKSDLIINNTKIEELPSNLKPGKYFQLGYTPLSKKYTKEQFEKIFPTTIFFF